MEWLNWLDKKTARTINDDFPKGKPPHIDYNKTPDNETDKTIPQIKRDFDDETHEDPFSTKAWESWLDKNNGIETDHKNDKKEEWDGKFDNATTRDDVKDEDEKAVSEEESLEKLTDGKLEEVEKLKSWESWLDKALTASDNVLNVAAGTKDKKENMHGLGDGARYQLGEAPVKGHGVNTPEQVTITKPDGTKEVTTQKREVAITAIPPKKAPQKDNKFMGTRATNMMTHDDFNASTERTGYPNPEKKKEPLGTTTDKPVKTAQQLDAEFNERVQPEKRSKPMSKKQLAARAAKKSWEGWLEKMQGAGDARFGNQHLTGLDQKPVDDEESEANILPELDQNNEKHEEKEEKEGKDNKPYKALSHE